MVRLFWISILFAVVFVQPAKAGSCKEALDAPAIDSGDETASAGNIFGHHVREIDGTSLTTPEAVRAALREVGDEVPLINGGNFSGWDFAALKLPLANVCLYMSNLKGSKWDDAEYSGIGFIEANLDGATFKGAKFDQILLRSTNLANVSMVGASLRKGLFDGGWQGSVENWNLTGADLSGFTFSCGITVGDGCPLDRNGVKFVQTNLTGADISSYVFWGGADYSGAILNGTKLAPRQLPELSDASFAGPVFLVGGTDAAQLTPGEIAELQRQNAEVANRDENPSFLCAKAISPVEKLICGEYESELRRKDRQMAGLYTIIRPKNPAIVDSQKKWLVKRNLCRDRDCLDGQYEERIGVMLTLLGEPEVLKPGEAALFINDTIEFPDAFRTTPLFGKITPVLVGASMGEVVLERLADGSYTISGESVGGNAHLCSVGGDGLRYNAKTGWFSGPREDNPKLPAAVFRVFGGEIEFPGNGHPDEAEFPGSESYAGCGMRATLGPMRRIEVSAELLAKHSAYYQSDDR
jgi:uncharacterized protein YjbI with pentapeptide repeats